MSAFKSAMKKTLRRLVVRLYAWRVEGRLDTDRAPKHIGVILDGNRRWAKAAGSTTKEGHEAGAAKIRDLLGWCEETGVEVVTLWMLSTDNLSREPRELGQLLSIVEGAVLDLAADGRWRVNHVGALDVLPERTRRVLRDAQEQAGDRKGILVNVAIGYGGRQEIADAVRSLLAKRAAEGQALEQVAESLSVEDISEHLYTRGQPDPDLVIRTSGEQRLSGFMLWQSAHSEYWFCEAYWPAFRKVDFLRALRDYAARDRRYGV
ncbi:isoprenyl transferase [Streptomyces avicenniae]|uniref:isoprenyl transferase n=1 Tax=Streptomyces avicenniae TaxID=500153 RepID=UPI000B25661B|nr:isoprenyl transferase [Streptomyces avicenniae]